MPYIHTYPNGYKRTVYTPEELKEDILIHTQELILNKKQLRNKRKHKKKRR